ncbi:Hypothetical predicted protein, partial [Marmota monax]
ASPAAQSWAPTPAWALASTALSLLPFPSCRAQAEVRGASQGHQQSPELDARSLDHWAERLQLRGRVTRWRCG